MTNFINGLTYGTFHGIIGEDTRHEDVKHLISYKVFYIVGSIFRPIGWYLKKYH